MFEEELRRKDALVSKLKEAGAPAFVVVNDEDSNWQGLRYFSGFRGTAGALIVFSDGETRLLLDGRYAAQGREQSPFPVTETSGGLVQEVKKILDERGVASALCEANRTSHALWRELDPKGLWKDGAGIVEALRLKKDAKEIAAIKKSAELAAEAFEETLAAVKAGTTEKRFEALLDYNIAKRGGETGFDMIVASGLRSVMPHGRATEKPFAAGEWVTVDYGARWEGYFCDITRNFSIGEPSREAAEMHDLILRAHRETAAMLRPGARGGDVHGRAVEIFAEKGLDKYFTHSLGHGFGLDIHEAPPLSGRRDSVLCAGEIVTIEPGLYIPGFGGMRIEDDYLITEDGAERLTSSLKQEFFRVPI